MDNTFKTKKALVTGSTKGIGRAITEKLASGGYSLLIVARNESNLRHQKERLKLNFPDIEIETYCADLSKINEIHALCKWIEHESFTVLVNNVGVFQPYSLLGEDANLMENMWTVNYLAAHHLCRTVGKNMKNSQTGHIFNIGSTASRSPVQAASYTVTKFAIKGLTHVLREELKNYGVKVTEIVPGSTRTSSWDGTSIPEQNFVKPEDIASALYQCLLLSGNSNVDEIVIRPQKGNIISDPLE